MKLLVVIHLKVSQIRNISVRADLQSERIEYMHL